MTLRIIERIANNDAIQKARKLKLQSIDERTYIEDINRKYKDEWIFIKHEYIWDSIVLNVYKNNKKINVIWLTRECTMGKLTMLRIFWYTYLYEQETSKILNF